MSEIYEYCYKIYRNLVHKLSNLATQLEKSKIISTKEKNIHKPCIIIGPNAVGKEAMINKLKNK